MLTPPDTWQILEIITQGNHIVVKVNGEVTVDYVDDQRAHDKGHLTLQISLRDGVVEFRKIEIKERPPSESSGISPAEILASDRWAWTAPVNLGKTVNSPEHRASG